MHQRTPVLSIRNARKSYGAAPALGGVSLDLYPGELLGFLGPNGAGKTTLIRCLSGRSRLDSGELTFAAQGPLNSLLGVVPQSIAVYEDLTAVQNLLAFGKLYGVPRGEVRMRVEAALRWSNLLDRRHQLVKTLSGGMKRRLNIACSVLHEPRILLLDEPTVGVDPQSRERIYEMLDELRKRGTAILLTTHQLDEAQFRCDRIAIVDQGKVVEVGSFDDLVAVTVGPNQRLKVRFHAPLPRLSIPLTMDATRTSGSCELADVTAELPRMLASLHAARAPTHTIVLQGPTLQDVFLHLTGKELRE
jgi:ABC-2 type transport system ATP-binding protein